MFYLKNPLDSTTSLMLYIYSPKLANIISLYFIFKDKFLVSLELSFQSLSIGIV